MCAVGCSLRLLRVQVRATGVAGLVVLDTDDRFLGVFENVRFAQSDLPFFFSRSTPTQIAVDASGMFDRCLPGLAENAPWVLQRLDLADSRVAAGLEEADPEGEEGKKKKRVRVGRARVCARV